MVGVTKDADPEIDTTTDEELNQMVQNTYMADQYQNASSYWITSNASKWSI